MLEINQSHKLIEFDTAKKRDTIDQKNCQTKTSTDDIFHEYLKPNT